MVRCSIYVPQQRPQPLALASSNLDTFDGDSPSTPHARHSRHASLAGAAAGSPAGSAGSGVMPAAERDGLAPPSVDWKLGVLAEEVGAAVVHSFRA